LLYRSFSMSRSLVPSMNASLDRFFGRECFLGYPCQQFLLRWRIPPRYHSAIFDLGEHDPMGALTRYTWAAPAAFQPHLIFCSLQLVLLLPVSVVFFFIGFMVAVLSKVAGAPTAPVHKLFVVSLFHWGDWFLQNSQDVCQTPGAILITVSTASSSRA
jgi:hypothetical protein